MLHIDVLRDELRNVECAGRRCMQHVQGELVPLDDVRWAQTKLPTRHGGCGLNDAITIWPAAQLSSFAAIARLLSEQREVIPAHARMLDVVQHLPHANSEKRPADFLRQSPLVWGQPAVLDKAVDVSVADARRGECVQKGSHKQALVAADLAEERKMKEHFEAVEKFGFGVVQFEKVPAVLESTGAFGNRLLALWEEAKAIHKALPHEERMNYVRKDKPRTWSAFTFAQMYPQRLSFHVNLWTARARLRGWRNAVAIGYSAFGGEA